MDSVIDSPRGGEDEHLVNGEDGQVAQDDLPIDHGPGRAQDLERREPDQPGDEQQGKNSPLATMNLRASGLISQSMLFRRY
jgi:hypothetical protein